MFFWYNLSLNFSILNFILLKLNELQVQNKTIKRLCHEQVIVTVNGLYPGPKLEVTDGDSVIVHVINNSPYNITIHW